VDETLYPRPETQIMQLTHRDVFLDFFVGRKNLILRLRSGMHLKVSCNELLLEHNGNSFPVVRFSKKFMNEISKKAVSGYVPYDAVIKFICAWKGKEHTEESAVILADIYFREG
jgi:ATP-dependent DNA helicase RecQ